MSSPTGPGAAGTVVVVGSANADLVVGVPRRPGAGETVLGGDLRVLPGGKGANQAVAAAPLVVLTPDGDNSIIVAPGANGRVTADDARQDVVRGAGVLLLQREISADASLAAALTCQGLVVLSLAPSGPVPEALLGRTDVLVVNEHEAADLLGARVPPADAAERLRRRGPGAVVVTLGAAGAVGVDAAGVHEVGAPRVDVVDTTGAGDAFTGALGWRLAAGDGLADALAVAVRVGALAVTREGAQPSFPTAAELAATAG
jgi:ribokinase